MTHEELLAYYTTPGIFTTVRGYEAQIDAMPHDIPAIAAAVSGLIVHQALAPAYKVTLSPEQIAQSQLHTAEAMLANATAHNNSPLTETRDPNERAVGVCRHFATLFVAILRHKGIPARVRAGFADYFGNALHGEHWVGEYWHAEQSRWILIDPTFDDMQRKIFKPDVDTLDVPRDRFLVAGDAWKLCRTGAADPKTFGVAGTENWGLIEVFGEIFQDLAALQKIELLPWGWYGIATDDANCDRETALLDRLAALTSSADAAAMEELNAILVAENRIRVPQETIAAVLEREKRVAAV